MRRGRRRGQQSNDTGNNNTDNNNNSTDKTNTNNNGTTTTTRQQQQKRVPNNRPTSQISSSVVFHEEDTEQLELALLEDDLNNIREQQRQRPRSNSVGQGGRPRSNSQSNNSMNISSSVIFHEEQIELFDEIDDLDPHKHEGGKIAVDPHKSTTSTTHHNHRGEHNNSTLSTSLSASGLSNSFSASRSLASSVLRSIHADSSSMNKSGSSNNLSSSSFTTPNLTVPKVASSKDTYEKLVASSNDGTLAEMFADIESKINDGGGNDLGVDEKEFMALKQSILSTLTEVSSTVDHTGGDDSNTNNTALNGGRERKTYKRASIVGGIPASQMSYEEQRELMAPDRSDRSLLVDFGHNDNDNEEGIEVDDNHTICSNSPENNNNGGEESNGTVVVSSVDWSSLCKSCKRAKNAFRDADSGQTVVKNMFLTHLRPLTAVLTLYAKRCCCGGGGGQEEGTSSSSGSKSSERRRRKTTLDEIKTRTTETKRALRFAISCLAPPKPGEDNNTAASGLLVEVPNVTNVKGSEDDAKDGVERFRVERRYRQELQEAAVKGFTVSRTGGRSSTPGLTASTRSTNTTTTNNGGGTSSRHHHHYGLQIPLVEILNDTDKNSQLSLINEDDEDQHVSPILLASIQQEKRNVRILAARLLCNLVTDNPLAAEIVLRDVPFSPSPDQVERRMAGSIIMGSRERAEEANPTSNSNAKNKDDDGEVVYWSDLITVTAQVQSSMVHVTTAHNRGGHQHRDDNNSDDREELAAVTAALHNLLTSLEARESLLELDDEMKRRELVKSQTEKWPRVSSISEGDSGEEEEDNSQNNMTPIDVGFEIASDGTLLNALLRNILPAKAVLVSAQFDREHGESSSRPKFKPPSSASGTSPENNLSDSATEWISLILERLASRGLLPRMLQSAAGTYMKSGAVTPEQVVLVSCIRQAVDDYHSTITPTGETGGFGRRRLSIAAKTAGMTMTTRPHPLWGRADTPSQRDSRTAVPVLLSLANEAEEIRLRANALRDDPSVSIYDGELNCTIRIIGDLCDILAQSLGKHAGSHRLNGAANNQHCFISDARSVLGRETSLISSCCKDLARILDNALAKNSGKKAREMELSPQDQQAAIVMVRLIGNMIYQCRYNQDVLRITPIPVLVVANNNDDKSASLNATPPNGMQVERTGLHVILSATSLAPACFTLREWCIVAIRNAIEGNAANAETCRRLEANQALGDTPELRKMGVKIDLDDNGNVQVKSRKDEDDCLLGDE